MISRRPYNALRLARSSILALSLLLAGVLALTLQAGVAQAAPTTFTVTTTDAFGTGSLGEAIDEANDNNNPTEQDTIEFDIPAATDPGCNATSGVCTIAPSSLPDITEPVIVDGYTQTDASANTLSNGNDAAIKIELSGASGFGSGITITRANSVVRGLAIYGWGESGIRVVGSAAGGNKIEGNYIGTDASGTSDLGNSADGIQIRNAPNATVGGTSPAARNLISGNGEDGVDVFGSGARGISVAGNYIGTDKTGTADLGNDFDGVHISGSPDGRLGGTTAGARNLISGNDEEGIDIGGSGASGNRIEGNYIGTNAAGAQELENGDDGVQIDDAPDNVVGGTTAGARNVISGNQDEGVDVQSPGASGNRIEGNYIGTDASGTSDLGNGVNGVEIEDAPGNLVGGTSAAARNVISGNQDDGVDVFEPGSSGNRIQGNYIGTAKNGTSALGNDGLGVEIFSAPDNVVGGTTTGARNVISGNGNEGVKVEDPDASGNRIEGNFIGTDRSGASALGNDGNGVEIENAPDNVVGGTTAGARNVISGNTDDGVDLEDPAASGNRVQGNYIGTDRSGTSDLGNQQDGVDIGDEAPGNLVGGTTTGARNVISGNVDDGVDIEEPGTSGNRVQGNYIGTGADGASALGNGANGVQIFDAPGNLVGGTSASASNLISANNGKGVIVDGADATGNRLLRNSVFANGGLGIDLADDGPTPNDPQDPDTGPNRLQNFPLITSAGNVSGQTTVEGTLNSTPNDAFNLQFFASPEADPSGFGEGKTFAGRTSVTTNSNGNATFTFTPGTPVSEGQVVTATATNTATNDTSEFSEAAEVEDGTAPTVVSTNPQDGATGVATGINVTATFSEPMKASTINTNTFRLFEKVGSTRVGVDAAVSYSAANKRAILNPNSDLTRGSTYIARVTTGAKDLAGNRLAQAREFRFTVRN